MDWFDDWALTLAVFIPLVGMAVVLLLPKAQEQAVKVTALVASLASLGIGIAILADFNYDQAGRLQFQANESWIDVIHSRYHIGIDGISLPLLILTMIIVPLCVIYSWDHFPEPHNPKAFLALILLLETGMLGTFVARGPHPVLHLLRGRAPPDVLHDRSVGWSEPRVRVDQVLPVHPVRLGVDARQLPGDLLPVEDADLRHGHPVASPRCRDRAQSTAILVFAGLFLGFAIKVPMFPFHTWLPDAHTEAPTVGSVLLAAVLLKLGTYGFIRIALPILPAGGPDLGAVDRAVRRHRHHLRRVVLPRATRHETPDRVLLGRPHGFRDARHRHAHRASVSTRRSSAWSPTGFITGMLFFLAGSVQERFHTREMSRLGGLLTQAPKMGWILGFCAMASLGLPGPGRVLGRVPGRPLVVLAGQARERACSAASTGTSGPTASTW